MQFPGMINNSEYRIYFSHVLTGNAVDFAGWVTTFSDQYTSLWNETPVYGRMDSLATFQRTSRQITLGFDVVAANALEALENLKNISTLVKFLYPTYTENNRSMQNTLSGGPLLGFKWTSLASGKEGAGGQALLYGYASGLTYAPTVEDGGFLADPGQRTPQEAADLIARPVTPAPPGSLPGSVDQLQQYVRALELEAAVKTGQQAVLSTFIPKTVNLNLTFTVLHTHLMGWNNGQFGGDTAIDQRFPYVPNVAINPEVGAAAAADGANEGAGAEGNPNERAAQAEVTD